MVCGPTSPAGPWNISPGLSGGCLRNDNMQAKESEDENMHQTNKSQTWIGRYRASGDSWHAVNFGKGVLIGGVIVLLVGLMVA